MINDELFDRGSRTIFHHQMKLNLQTKDQKWAVQRLKLTDSKDREDVAKWKVYTESLIIKRWWLHPQLVACVAGPLDVLLKYNSYLPTQFCINSYLILLYSYVKKFDIFL